MANFDLTPTADPHLVVDAQGIAELATQLATQIAAAHRQDADLLLLGIPTRGVPLANRIAAILEHDLSRPTRVGQLDITMYRDDLRANPTRSVGRTRINGPVDDAHVVLIDDVLFSGRTIVAALDALRDLGRPRRVSLAVLVDRGHRELPVSADFTGLLFSTDPADHVQVLLTEHDDIDGVRVNPPRTDLS